MDKHQIRNIYDQFLCSTGISIDTRTLVPGNLFFALSGPNFDANQFVERALELGASYVCAKGSVSGNSKVIGVEDPLEVLQQLAKFHRNELGVPIVALTGSNGKTTTKELMHAVLSKKFNCAATHGNLNNHIGVPLTLLSLNKFHEIAIVEMGANHLKEIEFLSALAQPDYGLITNIGLAHLEGFGSVDGILEGKTELYRHLKNSGGIVFVDGGDDRLMKSSQSMERVLYSEKGIVRAENANQYNSEFCTFDLMGPDNSCTISSQLIGNYNIQNMLAAACVGRFFQVGMEDIQDALNSYVPQNKRSQLVHGDRANKIYLDAYNANPSSMMAALDNFEKQDETELSKVVILGDMLELGSVSKTEHRKIYDRLLSMDIDQAYLVGPLFSKLDEENQLVQYFDSSANLILHLKEQGMANSLILIKGSRGIKLETLLEAGCF